MANVKRYVNTEGIIVKIEFEGEDYESAREFLSDCIQYADDADLVHLSTPEDIESQINGYKAGFGDELPELLEDPYWMTVCWNQAVSKEREWRHNRR